MLRLAGLTRVVARQRQNIMQGKRNIIIPSPYIPPPFPHKGGGIPIDMIYGMVIGGGLGLIGGCVDVFEFTAGHSSSGIDYAYRFIIPTSFGVAGGLLWPIGLPIGCAATIAKYYDTQPAVKAELEGISVDIAYYNDILKRGEEKSKGLTDAKDIENCNNAIKQGRLYVAKLQKEYKEKDTLLYVLRK